MKPVWLASTTSRCAHGVFIVTVTWSGPVTSTDCTGLKAFLVSALCSITWSRLARSASASSGVPSWNVMSGRSVIVHVRKSSLGVIDSAR